MNENKVRFCGEITYENESGWVHSDICWACGDDEGKVMTSDYREFLHNCLDEWLDKTKGEGAFWVGDPEYFNDFGLED